jgi:hypothetical protein
MLLPTRSTPMTRQTPAAAKPPLPQYQADHWAGIGRQDFRFTGYTGRYIQMNRIAKGHHEPQEASVAIAQAYMAGFTAAALRARKVA